MNKVVSVNERGTLTLPKELRHWLGIRGEAQLVAEKTEEGILLRAGATFPIEVYSEKRLAEFREENEEALAGLRIKKRK